MPVLCRPGCSVGWPGNWVAVLALTVDENTSDGYHTFKELYEFRKVYNAALFNEWVRQGQYSVHKSKRHATGELCFGGGWFIVVATLPGGDISNHYEMADWDLFQCEERETASTHAIPQDSPKVPSGPPIGPSRCRQRLLSVESPLTYPEAVLIDIARAQMRGQSAEYFQLDPDTFADGNDWLKKTETHQYMLVVSWFVCTHCHHAEQYCECDGLLEELTRPDTDDADGIEFYGADTLFDQYGLFDWDWGL